jgi:ribosomal protein S3
MKTTINPTLKDFNRMFYVYYEIIKDHTKTIKTVTDFSLNIEGGVYILNIKSYFPGLIIGKGGKDIDGFKNYIQKELNIKNFKINLEEEKMWNNLL